VVHMLSERYECLTIRTPEATSLARSTAFNPHNVGKVFENLMKVYDRHVFGSGDIYNCDETDIPSFNALLK